MIRNYLKIATRTLLKNQGFTFINIIGLAIGMTSFLLILQYVRFEKSYENFHEKAGNIYRVTLELYNGSEFVGTDCETYAPIGPMLKDRMPEVLDFVRFFNNDGLHDVQVNEMKFLEEGMYYTDPSVFDIFSLMVLDGDQSTALTKPFQVVITESIAKKYFNRNDVAGETLKIDNRLYEIAAVITDLPPNTHLKYNFLLSHVTYGKINEWYKEDGWIGNNEYTYLLMEDGTDLASFNNKLAEFSNSLKDKITDERFIAEPVKDIHLYSQKGYEPEANGNARTVHFLMIIAIAIIVIAWVNYINLSTARAVERAREVGIRKVMGSYKSQLVFQFLAESVAINTLGGMVTLILFQSSLPFFSMLTGQPLSNSIAAEPLFWLTFCGMLLTGSLFSGLYPAFVLSSFQPVSVLKGKFKSSTHGKWLREGLVVFQFGASVLLLVCMVTVYLQINHLREQDLGMNIDQTLVFKGPQTDIPDSLIQSVYSSIKTEMLRLPDVTHVVQSESFPGMSQHDLSTTTSVRKVGQEESGSYNYYHIGIDAEMIPALGMKLLAGRNFDSTGYNHDVVIVNEEAAQRLGFANPEEAVGSKVTFYTQWPGEPSTIIGVISNFYYHTPKESHAPMILRFRETGEYFALRLNTHDMQKTVKSVQEVWNKVCPNSVFHYFFLDQNYERLYSADIRFGKIITTFSALLIFIACMGLFGLSSFIIMQRTKEIGIRKVLGASIRQIVQLLSHEFMRVVAIASLLALPVAYYIMDGWLSNYSVRININLWMFLVPVVLILLIALMTVSFQTVKTALANPTESLRQE